MEDIQFKIDQVTPKTDRHVFVFDLDNTLVKTNRANNKAYKEAIQIVLGNVATIRKGRITRSDLLTFFPGLSKPQFDAIVKLKEDLYVKYLHETALNKQLSKMLKLLKEEGNETILLTECSRIRANQVCDYYSVTPLFNKLYFKEDYKNGNKYQFLETMIPSICSVVLFENEKSEIKRARKHGLLENQIITIKF